jgi:hypothetical protein
LCFRECEINAELKKSEKNANQIAEADVNELAEFEEAKKMSEFFADLGREKGPIDPVTKLLLLTILISFSAWPSMGGARVLWPYMLKQMNQQKFPFSI